MTGSVKGSGGGVHGSLFEKIIAPENIFAAWREFQRGKMKKPDVLAFAERAEEHLLELAGDLSSGQYAHGQYTRFVVHDPKRREIAKASVRDRVLHHAIHRVLAPLFDRSFIFDSYSSRIGKGTHTAGKRFRQFAWTLSRNRTKTIWVLQLDVRKFFDSIDHRVLLGLLERRIKNDRTMQLLDIIIQSFETSPGKGISLGNLTSQLFSSVYLDPLDQFVKRTLQVRCYLRYADDIAVLSRDRGFLERRRDEIGIFLVREIGLKLHPDKVSIGKWHEGIDFLGLVHFLFHAVLRTKTKRRLLARLSPKNAASYFGVTRHVRAHGLEQSMHGILEV